MKSIRLDASGRMMRLGYAPNPLLKIIATQENINFACGACPGQCPVCCPDDLIPLSASVVISGMYVRDCPTINRYTNISVSINGAYTISAPTPSGYSCSFFLSSFGSWDMYTTNTQCIPLLHQAGTFAMSLLFSTDGGGAYASFRIADTSNQTVFLAKKYAPSGATKYPCSDPSYLTFVNSLVPDNTTSYIAGGTVTVSW